MSSDSCLASITIINTISEYDAEIYMQCRRNEERDQTGKNQSTIHKKYDFNLKA